MGFERRLQQAARNAFDDSAAALPPDVLARLAAIRAAALAQQTTDAAAPAAARETGSVRNIGPRVPSRWAPGFALAATLLFAVGVWNQTLLQPLPALSDPVATRVAMDMELLNDLEFVAWMEMEAQSEADASTYEG